jgi:hypothetical protein
MPEDDEVNAALYRADRERRLMECLRSLEPVLELASARRS